MLLSPEEATRIVRAHVAPFPAEHCPLGSAAGRILRETLRADRDLPPFDRVTMDGFAVRSAEARPAAASGRGWELTLHGTPQAAGMMARTLPATPDVCIEVMTGAVLPDGADAVVPYEDTRREGLKITLSADATAQLAAGAAVHRRGSDHAAGDEVVPAGTRLTGRAMAIAAACGYTQVMVAASPRLALISTGDELVEIGSPVLPHQIRRSNDLALRTSLAAAGYARVECFHLRDVPAEIEAGLRDVLARFDGVIITGGVSKGRLDFIPATLASLGVTPLFHGVAQRPGKPLWFGRSQRHTPVFALPGNPVSCFTCLHRYLLPALDRASGHSAPAEHRVAAEDTFPTLPKLTHFVPVRIRVDNDGRHWAQPRLFNTSGDFPGLLDTDGFVEVPPQATAHPRGTSFVYTPWV